MARRPSARRAAGGARRAAAAARRAGGTRRSSLTRVPAAMRLHRPRRWRMKKFRHIRKAPRGKVTRTRAARLHLKVPHAAPLRRRL